MKSKKEIDAAANFKARTNELKAIAADSTNGMLSIFSAMTPANFNWINESVEIAMKATATSAEYNFTKYWILNYYYFPADIYILSHQFLPTLPARLLKDKDSHIFTCLSITAASLADIGVDKMITPEKTKKQTALLFKDMADDSPLKTQATA